MQIIVIDAVVPTSRRKVGSDGAIRKIKTAV